MKVKEELAIIWNSDEGQTESPGIEFFGLYRTQRGESGVDPGKLGWTRPDFEFRTNIISTPDYVVGSISIRVNKWPDDETWSERVETTLRELVAAGSTVSWAGGYDCNWSPEVLNPTAAAGNVYAAYSEKTGFYCNSRLSEELMFLDDEQLAALWKLITSA